MSSVKLVKVALVGALYFALTVGVAPLSYGPVQFRFSEILVLLCFYRKDYALSIVLGCLLANFFSPFGIYDVIFGTLSSVVTVIFVMRSRNLFTASLGALPSCVIIGWTIFYVTGAPLVLTTLSVMAGEFAVVTMVGYPMFKLIERNDRIMGLIVNF